MKRDWNEFWTSTLENNYPEIEGDFYFHLLLSIKESKGEVGRLLSINRDYASLLGDKSPSAVALLTNPELSQEEVHTAYVAFLNLKHSESSESRYRRESCWSPKDITIEPNADTRIWAIETRYQYAKDNNDGEWKRGIGNSIRLGGVNILCHLVGILDVGAILGAMINNDSMRRKVLESDNPFHRFISLVYVLDEGVNHVAEDSVPLILKKGCEYLYKNLPTGITEKSLAEKYPIFVDWLEFKMAHIKNYNIR